MSKMLIAACFAASVMAIAPPRMELDLSGISNLVASHQTMVHDLGFTQPNGVSVTAKQDYTEVCPVLNSTTTSCPIPEAHAWDSYDKELNTTQRIYMIDNDNTALDEPLASATVDYTVRSTWVMKWDARDESGNYAEQAVFALIVDDQQPPVISLCNGETETVEAASTWTLCNSSAAADNYDGDLTANIIYRVTRRPSTGAHDTDIAWRDSSAEGPAVTHTLTCASTCTVDDAVAFISIDNVGLYEVTLSVSDHAGIYGQNEVDNVATATKRIVIRDSRKPWITIDGANPVYEECDSSDTNDRTALYSATTHDYLDAETASAPTKTVFTFADGDEDDSEQWVAHDGDVTLAAVVNYGITYNAQDTAGNSADEVERIVHVRDTTAPIISLVGSQTVQIDAGSDYTEPGRSCSDTCTEAPTITESWIDGAGQPLALDTATPGHYILLYTCQDASGNSAQDRRTVVVQDGGDPVITLMCNNTLLPSDHPLYKTEVGTCDEVLEASHDYEYVDMGATCEDYVGGDLTNDVEVGGHVVNIAVPGEYVIEYTCRDPAGRATQATRTVTVEDTTSPEITMVGTTDVVVCAGFPYTDDGATATDTLDGDLTSSIRTIESVMNWEVDDSSNVYTSVASCKEIQDRNSEAASGEYFITKRDVNSQPGTGVYNTIHSVVFCDFDSTCDGVAGPFTWYRMQADTAVTPYGQSAGSDEGACGRRGLRMQALPDTCDQARTALVNHYGTKYCSMPDASCGDAADITAMGLQQIWGQSTQPSEAEKLTLTTDQYICGGIDTDTNTRQSQSDGVVGQARDYDGFDTISYDKNAIPTAIPGTYTVTYTVTDAHDNVNEQPWPVRTITAKDVLAPVISLHLKQDGVYQRIHVSGTGVETSSYGTEGGCSWNATEQIETPAADTPAVANSFPSYMEEQVQSSLQWSWMIGAVASAVTGLAILGMSSRRENDYQKIASVPV